MYKEQAVFYFRGYRRSEQERADSSQDKLAKCLYIHCIYMLPGARILYISTLACVFSSSGHVTRTRGERSAALFIRFAFMAAFNGGSAAAILVGKRVFFLFKRRDIRGSRMRENFGKLKLSLGVTDLDEFNY